MNSLVVLLDRFTLRTQTGFSDVLLMSVLKGAVLDTAAVSSGVTQSGTWKMGSFVYSGCLLLCTHRRVFPLGIWLSLLEGSRQLAEISKGPKGPGDVRAGVSRLDSNGHY